MSSIVSALFIGLIVTVILLLCYGLTSRSWVGYAIMPRRGAVIEPVGSESLSAELLWPAIVSREEGGWLTAGKARIRAADAIRSDRALDYYSAWINAEPDNAQARLWRAMLLTSLSQLTAPLDDCLEVVRLDPENATAHFLLGNLAHAIEDNDAAHTHYDEAVRLRADFVGAYVGLGNAWLARRQADKAIVEYGRALDLDSSHAAAWYGRGCAHYASGDYWDAMEDFTHAIHLSPNHVAAYHNRATSRYRIGDLEGALQDIDFALGFTTRDDNLFITRAAIRRALGQPDLALADLGKAIRLDGGEPEPFCQRGVLWLETGEYQRAYDDFRDAMAIDPVYSPAFNYQAWLLATCPLDDVRDGPAAFELAREACRLTEYKIADYLDTLAAACAAVGDFGAACDWQRKVIDLSPADEPFLQAARARLALYAHGAPCRDPQKSVAAA